DKKLAAKAPVFKKKSDNRDAIRFVNFDKYCRLEKGRVFNFPFNWLGLTELDPRQPGRQLHATLFKAAILVE
ncbi:hypothetical protein, partial [Aeromonas caviae]|uniref:hypothetical protein n=1 Tax=Aeromonas caviae TaxID=648 RepID=UPI001CC4E399